MKKLLLTLSTLTILVIAFSCKQEKAVKIDDLIKSSGQKFTLSESKEFNEAIPLETNEARPRPQPFVNEKLPNTYTKRTFIEDLGALGYDIFYIPGHIVKFNSSDSSYEMVTVKALLLNGKSPITESISDGLLYSNKINKSASFNGSSAIAGVSVDNESIAELLIQDMTKSIVPDSLIDVSKLTLIKTNIPADQIASYYWVRSSLLTFVNYKKYRRTQFEANVNLTYVTAEGKVYSSNEKFARERMVSLDLVRLDKLIF